jgi:IS1 family transposase
MEESSRRLRKGIFGEGIEQSAISTNLIERQNLTLRRTTTEFSRKTIGFSKVEYG